MEKGKRQVSVRLPSKLAVMATPWFYCVEIGTFKGKVEDFSCETWRFRFFYWKKH